MKFSVIIPTYNRPDFLREALNSVAAQTYTDYEVIVVNDYKPDEDIVNEIVAGFEKVTVIHHPKSLGGNAARNNGIKQATGELIAFLDDDDLWLPNKLEAHAKAHAVDTAIGLVYSDCIIFFDSEKANEKEAKRPLPQNLKEAMRKGDFCPITSTSVSVTASAIKACGLFDEDLVSFQDWDMWFRIAELSSFAHVPQSLVKFRQHYGLRTSKSIEKRLKGLSQIVAKWKGKVDISEFEKKFLRRTYYFYACDLVLTNKRSKAFTYSFRLFNPAIANADSIKRFIKVMVGIVSPSFLRKQAT
ncbi:glycosyltransferase family 2 protein [Mucilaginibacter sp. JRF]|uniref:glycosyltransferase family 2 protein n=1 Tax=Mucilaginibacter sp. JRF TaxID=2780088 RepID=UPI001880F308|nr:glycosyltransferase family 2 protein [Mucilaginibacter sp. JRF]MBE9585361.1 glycosyltransferase family 2 protein [Mucilaginibacter sp. JRF]